MQPPQPNLERLFAVPVAYFDMPDPEPLAEQLKRLFLECDGKDEFRNTIRRDTQKGDLFESRFDLFTWDQAPVRQLASFCNACMSSAVHEVSDYTPAELRQLQFDYHAWFHVTRQGGYQGLHNHSNASWSAIFCVDPGDEVADRPESGAVRFHDTRTNANYYADAGNARLAKGFKMGTYQIKHRLGRMWVFPSYLLHEVLPYVGERPRIIVAMNAWVRRVRSDA
jgi:uncharacterized protein (TIGR02466 family)